MVISMTGFGGAEKHHNGVIYSVEIKSVNNRYFKTRVKLPDAVGFLEEEIEKLLRENIVRGSVNYSLEMRNVSAGAMVSVDMEAVQSYVDKLGQVKQPEGMNCTIDISQMLHIPGVIVANQPAGDQAEEIKKLVMEISRIALEKMNQMRQTEGAALAVDLLGHCEQIKENIDSIRGRSKDTIQQYSDKLRKRVDELLADEKTRLDESTVLREVAVFADKSDISEEIARLDSHLQQFAETCNKGGSSGRRLDFIAQEMLREANTIGSKAWEVEVVHQVVDIKCLIDKIKEQVQNVE